MPKKMKKKKQQNGTSRAASASTIHKLEVTLLEIEPRIWRRFTIRSNITLAKLHNIIQIVMGWTDSHLHQFVTPDETRYAPPTPYGDPDWDKQINNSRKIRVCDVLPAKDAQLLYEYDFGDGWEHLIEVVDIHSPERGTKYPQCLTGERACLPEDCGGPYSYPELLAALTDLKHPEHEELAEWIGGEFDPEAFDLDEINGILAQLH